MREAYDPYPRRTAGYSAAARATALSDGFAGQSLASPAEEFRQGFRVDGLAVAALLVILFLIGQFILDQVKDQGKAITSTESETAVQTEAQSRDPSSRTGESELEQSPMGPVVDIDPLAITYPYDQYWVTQGPHGQSYGHLAIDLAAGKGSPIKSPIHGEITSKYVDQYGNTTLIIENEAYQVLMLHGDYSAEIGQKVRLGDVVGAESNHGYTKDQFGNLCAGRDCGYHTHLNVFDKRAGANVNPLDVLSSY